MTDEKQVVVIQFQLQHGRKGRLAGCNSDPRPWVDVVRLDHIKSSGDLVEIGSG